MSDDIPNKELIFNNINKALGRDKDPVVEYLLAKPHSSFKLFGIGFNPNLYGHSAVKYTMPDKTTKVFNITGYKEGQLVQFHTPESYIFSRDSVQGGVYNREFIGVRVEELPDENIIKMDKYFQEIHDRGKKSDAKFDIVLGPIFNTFRNILPTMSERGNCARWASAGLKEAGVTYKKTSWPKTLAIDIFENTDKTDVKTYDNINIVSYRSIDHAKRDYGVSGDSTFSLVGPLQTFRSLFYWNLESYAKIVVKVMPPNNKIEIKSRDLDQIKQPSKIRNTLVNNNGTIAVSTITTAILLKKYPGNFFSNIASKMSRSF